MNLNHFLTKNNILNYSKQNLNAKKAIGLIHKIFLTKQKLSNSYTASTKTKKEVRGGGRKPWRQKGTGQARAGSIRSSIWVGGGITFGPKPRIVYKKINKKENRLAISLALFLKDSKIEIVDSNFVKNINNKTKNLILKLENISKFEKLRKTLIITTIEQNTLFIASKNLKKVDVCLIDNLNLRSILNSSLIIFTLEAFNLYLNTYGII
jgi:large subunit ribosomal protein L4